MNKETVKFYNLARMYEYLADIEDLKSHKSIEEIFSDKMNRYAIAMCITQMGSMPQEYGM